MILIYIIALYSLIKRLDVYAYVSTYTYWRFMAYIKES